MGKITVLIGTCLFVAAAVSGEQTHHKVAIAVVDDSGDGKTIKMPGWNRPVTATFVLPAVTTTGSIRFVSSP